MYNFFVSELCFFCFLCNRAQLVPLAALTVALLPVARSGVLGALARCVGWVGVRVGGVCWSVAFSAAPFPFSECAGAVRTE